MCIRDRLSNARCAAWARDIDCAAIAEMHAQGTECARTKCEIAIATTAQRLRPKGPTFHALRLELEASKGPDSKLLWRTRPW
eukprot:10667249-Alexandrium_andersonii.AAC.1